MVCGVRFNIRMPTRNALLASALSAAALLGPTTVAHAAEPDLLSRWALDTVGATTPNAVDSRLNGTPVTGTPVAGRFGSGLSLSPAAGTQGLLAADSAGLVEPKSVTVLAWVKRASAQESWAPIVAKSGVGRDDPGQSCELNAFALMAGGEEGPHFAITTADGSAGSQTLSMTDPLPAASVWDNKWHAVAGIFDASSRTLSVALDGKIISTKPADGTSIAYGSFPQRALSVGRYPHSSCDGPGLGFDGGVDEVRIYGRALNAAELAHLQAASATTPPSLPIGGDSPAPSSPTQPETPSTPASPALPSTPAGPATQQPTPAPPNPVSIAPLGSAFVGGATSKLPKAPPSALKDALKKAEKPLSDLLKSPKSPSKIFKETPKLKKKELEKLKPSTSLDAVLDQLELGLPVQVKVPATARYAYVGAALTVRRKTPAGKIEIHTIALPPAVFPAKNGIASGRITIDAAAAKVLRKSGAVDAAVGIVSVLVSDLPNLAGDQKNLIDEKLGKQSDLTKKLEQQIKKAKEADKTVDKFEKLADKAKGTSGEKKAEARAEEAQQKRDLADEATEQTAKDLAEQQQQAIDEMIQKIIEFIRKMQEQNLQGMQKLTRV